MSSNHVVYSPISVNWIKPENLASDLEAICPVSGTPGHFLIAESGYYQGKYGRVYSIQIQSDIKSQDISATVDKVWNWPDRTERIEAISCLNTSKGRIIIAARQDGQFYHGPIRFDQAQSLLTLQAVLPLYTNELPHFKDKSFRMVTDLCISENEIWAAAALEISNSGPGQGTGPFSSIIYRLGTLRTDGDFPIEFDNQMPPHQEIAGYKVEALTPTLFETRPFAFATDDESLSGTWRLLIRP